jgi:hypothetical protein
MLGSAFDEQRLQRCKEIPRRITDAILSRSILAEFRAQFDEDLCGARHFAVARLQPLKLSQKTVPRQRRQPLQEFLNPIGQRHCNVICREEPVSAIGRSRTGIAVRIESTKACRRKLSLKLRDKPTAVKPPQKWKPVLRTNEFVCPEIAL